MKRATTLTLLIALSFATISAQTLDTLSMGAGYATQLWYKFETDKETKAPISNWDLAFSVRKQDAAIWVNHAASLYKAVAPASAWATMTVDTTALMAANQTQVNADSSWITGAMNRSGDNVFDYGWGNYNVASHNVTGDSVYVIRSTTDAKWHKILIERLALDTSYFVRIADLNGANQVIVEIKKGDYTGKNFGYYSFAAAAQFDVEFQ